MVCNGPAVLSLAASPNLKLPKNEEHLRSGSGGSCADPSFHEEPKPSSQASESVVVPDSAPAFLLVPHVIPWAHLLAFQTGAHAVPI